MKLNTVDATRPYGPPNIAIAATISRLPVTISTQDPLSIPSMTFDKPSAAPSNESYMGRENKEKHTKKKILTKEKHVTTHCKKVKCFWIFLAQNILRQIILLETKISIRRIYGLLFN